MVRLAERHQISLRQNYNRKAPYLLMMIHRYNHAKQLKHKNKALKQLKTLVGHVYRDIERQLSEQPVLVQAADGLLGRNYLKGELSDALHAIRCAAGHNIRLILGQLRIFWL